MDSPENQSKNGGKADGGKTAKKSVLAESTEARQSGSTTPPKIQDDHGVPLHLVYSCVLVGLLLTVCSAPFVLSASAYTVSANFAALIACIGLGLVLVAFGTRAAGTWKSWAVTGGDAVALVLFWVQWQCQPSLLPSLRGELRGTSNFDQVSMWASSAPLFVTRRKTRGDFEFAAFPDDIARASQLVLNITNKPGVDPQEFYIDCISTDLVRQHLGDAIALGLTIRPDPATRAWYLYSGMKKFGKFNNDDCDADDKSAGKASLSMPDGNANGSIFAWTGMLFGPAYAQTVPSKGAADKKAEIKAPTKDETIREILAELKSSDADTRLEARSVLSFQNDTISLKLVADSWNTQNSSYRDDLGRLVAWNSAIKQDMTTGGRLTDAMGEDRIRYVVALTGYPDQTMRSQATTLVARLLQYPALTKQKAPDNYQVLLKAALEGASTPDLATTGLRRDIQFSPQLVAQNSSTAVGWASCNLNDEKAKNRLTTSVADLFTSSLASQQPDFKIAAGHVRDNVDAKCAGPLYVKSE